MITLTLGDSNDILKTIEDKSFDAVVTDPPWNLGYFDDDKKTWEEYAEWLNGMILHFERIARHGVWVFQSTKAIPHVSHLFKGYGSFAAVKNFSQMTKKSLPNCWDIAYYKGNYGYKGNGRNWFLCNTAGMLKERTNHPTPRTVDVMEYIINMYSWKSILDPFMGSATTAIPCIKHDIDFTGIEKDENHYKTAEDRIDKEIEKKQALLL